MWLSCYIVGWISAAILTSLLTRLAIRLAPKWGFLDIPLHEGHKAHRKSTPVMGGIAMLIGWLFTIGAGLLAARLLSPRYFPELARHLDGIRSVLSSLGVIALGATAITLFGMKDDHKAMKALPKFAMQFLVAALTACFGMKTSFLHAIPGANHILTIFWIVTVMNAMNFFDNMDGLASGAAMLGSLVFLFVAIFREQHFVAMLASVLGGCSMGFLFHNAPPARIFMGDSGSHFLGYMLAVTGIMTTYYVPGESPTPTPILIPLLALAVPLVDAITVVIIRLKLHVPIYRGDNRHISHRFVNLGLTRPLAVLLVLLLSFIIGTVSLALLWLPPAGSLLILAVISALFAIILIIQFNSTNTIGRS